MTRPSASPTPGTAGAIPPTHLAKIQINNRKTRSRRGSQRGDMNSPKTESTVRPWPVFASLQGYRRVWVRADVVAGLTVWAVLVPEALAYATIAGCLSVDESLHCVGVAGALHLDSGRCRLDLGEVGGGEFEVGGGEVLLKSAELAGAWDRDDPRLLG